MKKLKFYNTGSCCDDWSNTRLICFWKFAHFNKIFDQLHFGELLIDQLTHLQFLGSKRGIKNTFLKSLMESSVET